MDRGVRTVARRHRLEQHIGLSTTNLTHDDVLGPFTKGCFQQFELSDDTFVALTTETLPCQSRHPVGLGNVHLTGGFDGDDLHLPRNENAHGVEGGGLSGGRTTHKQHGNFVLERNPQIRNHQGGHGAERHDVGGRKRVVFESSNTEG